MIKINPWLKKRLVFTVTTAILGAGYFVFEYVDENPPTAINTPTMEAGEEADYYGRGLTHKQFNKDGQLSQELQAERSDHYPNSEETYFTAPEIIVTNSDGQRWQITAQHALNQDATRLVTFRQDVVIQPLDSQPEDSLILNTERLFYHSDSRVADTPELVTITRHDSRITATGMTLTLATELLELHQEVNTYYVPQSRP